MLVGRVTSKQPGKGGQQHLSLRWYMPKTDSLLGKRSKYGKGGWTLEYLIDARKRVDSVGLERVSSVSSKFASLTSQGKLPRFVWDAVGSSSEEGGEEESQDESRVRPTPLPPALPAAVEEDVRGGGAGSLHSPVPAVHPTTASVEPATTTVRQAAYYRSRRDGAAPNVES